MKVTTKILYALAARLGIVGKDCEDDLHILVYGITGKEHIGELTQAEKEEVRKELEYRLERKNCVPGMMTADQKKLAWRLVYRLEELKPSEVRPVKRLAGAIQKILGTTVSEDDPFRWITFDEGSKLIEGLKRYVRSTERKLKKK